MHILLPVWNMYSVHIYIQLRNLFPHTIARWLHVPCSDDYRGENGESHLSMYHNQLQGDSRNDCCQLLVAVINPQRTCARVTVLVPSVCLFSLFWHLAQSGVQTAVSATSARYGHEIKKGYFSLKRFVPVMASFTHLE